jgi:hypothetical protein
MPKGLKNAGATYQRAITAIFHDLMGDILEDYVYDILVKSKTASQHIQHLEKIAERAPTTIQPSPKPSEVCLLSLISGDASGIHRQQARNRGRSSRRSGPSSTCLHLATLRSYEVFDGQLQPLRRFISQASTRCESMNQLLQKNADVRVDRQVPRIFQETEDVSHERPSIISTSTRKASTPLRFDH